MSSPLRKCSKCNKSLKKKKSDRIHGYQENPPGVFTCNRCLQAESNLKNRAKSGHDSSSDATSNDEEDDDDDTIVIDMPKAKSSHQLCIFGCQPNAGVSLRHLKTEDACKLTSIYKIIVDVHCRACESHFRDDGQLNFDDMPELNASTSKCRMSAKNLKELIVGFTKLVNKLPESKMYFDDIDDEQLKYECGVDRDTFTYLANRVGNTVRDRQQTGIYLMRFRRNDTYRALAYRFGVSVGTIAGYITRVRSCLTNSIVAEELGLTNSRRPSLVSNQSTFANILLKMNNEENQEKLIVVCDSTYIDVEKSSNYTFQKKSYYEPRKENTVKAFMIVTTNGLIVDVIVPHEGVKSDGQILNTLLETESMSSFFKQGDFFVLDRGKTRYFNYFSNEQF